VKPKKESLQSFEKSLERLEAIVEKLESEDLGLDASLALFEEGISLSRVCREKLSDVERRVELVLKEADGGYKAAPFPAGDEGEAEGEDPD
jgi:exodeoxyribonuclease VII small subunit